MLCPASVEGLFSFLDAWTGVVLRAAAVGEESNIMPDDVIPAAFERLCIARYSAAATSS